MNYATKLLRTLIREQVRSSQVSHRRRIVEGGGAFPEVNSAVPKSLLSKNIENALSRAGLKKIKYEIVGNKTKDFFGDIDIAVDIDEMKSFLKVPEDEEVWPRLKSYLDGKVTYAVKPGLSQFHILVDLIGKSGKPSDAIDPTTHEVIEDTPGKIQIDVFVGNLGWMKDTSSGAPPESKYKAVYRNFLLFAIIGNIPNDLTKEDKDIAKQYPDKTIKKKILTNFRRGVIERLYYEEQAFGKSGKPLKDPKIVTVSEKITSSADDLYGFFLKSPVKWEKINSYEELLKQVKSSNFKFPALREKILSVFRDDLTKNSLAVPDDVLQT